MMLFKILKKDLKRRKGVNFILLLFIMLASIFLVSSVNNIIVVTSALDYFLDYANIPDLSLFVAETEDGKEEAKLLKYLENDSEYVDKFEFDTMLMMSEKNIFILKNKKEVVFDTSEVDLYLGAQGGEFDKVYDPDGESFQLNSGEIAMTQALMDKNNMVLGDSIKVNIGEIEKRFVLKYVMKDAAMRMGMIGMSRIILNENDFMALGKSDVSKKLYIYHIMTEDLKTFKKDFDLLEARNIKGQIDKDLYRMAYSYDLIFAALLMVIGVCLILIALLVLRFTLVFTLEEDFREIGIMKAVGFRNFSIEKIYLIKYLAIVSVGAILGLFISFPISKFMVKSVSVEMIMKESVTNLWLNIICVAAIVILVMLFCYSCTRKLNKISAIAAIRSGQNGERFRKRSGLHLYRKKKMPVSAFLGINDMVSHVRRYMVLMVTFCISFILITVPLNTINTMRSKEMAEKFNLNPDSSVYLSKIESTMGGKSGKIQYLEEHMNKVVKELKDKGYKAELTSVVMFNFQYMDDKENEKTNLLTIQILGKNNNFSYYDKGEAPLLTNEIAFSETVMKENKWKIGDSVETIIGGKEKRFIITASYSDYMNMGKSARLNPVIDCSTEMISGCWSTMVDIDTDQTQEELAKVLTKELPDYKWSTAQEIVDKNVGSIQGTLDKMLIPMTGMLCGVVMLITLLMEKLFIVREKGEIAMLKSVGFKNKNIRNWQIMRMVAVVLISMIAAIPMSLLSNTFILKPIFSMMGAHVRIQVVPWQVYGVYPGVLLVGIITATIFATRSVRKINIQELNNLE